METQSQFDGIPDVSEQTRLDNGPIKIRWSGHDRRRVRRGLMAALESGHTQKAVGYPVMSRQKTQIVIKTEEELEALQGEMFQAKWHVQKRISNEIDSQLSGDDSDAGSQLSEQAETRQANTDLEVLLNETVIPHARTRAMDVWPGGTVDMDEIYVFWNPQLQSSAGMAYHKSACPRRYVPDEFRYAVGLAPAYYYKHGQDELLEVVRHELIHMWQYRHPDGGRGGHGPTFKQWIDDLDTHRHCKLW